MFFYNFLKGSDTTSALIGGLAFLLVVVFSIVMHEISHGYAALLNGDPTAKDRGRLTLNPVAHFDLVGILMFLIVGFGWAKPVPINTGNFKNYKKGKITVSIAGVCMNLTLAAIFCVLLLILKSFLVGFSTSNRLSYVLVLLVFYILIYGITVNMMLAFFNLLPIYPLDGFNLLNTFLPYDNKYQYFMVKYGFFILIGLMIVGRIGDMFNFPYLNIFGLFSRLIEMLIGAILQ